MPEPNSRMEILGWFVVGMLLCGTLVLWLISEGIITR